MKIVLWCSFLGLVLIATALLSTGPGVGAEETNLLSVSQVACLAGHPLLVIFVCIAAVCAALLALMACRNRSLKCPASGKSQPFGRETAEGIRTDGTPLEAHAEPERRVRERMAELAETSVRLKEETDEREGKPDVPTPTKARLEYLLASTPGAAYAATAAGAHAVTFVSESVRDLLGYEPREITEVAGFWTDHIHPDDRPAVCGETAHFSQPGCRSLEYRFLHKDGKYRWLHDEVRLVGEGQGRPLERIGYILDITSRKEIEEELRSREKLFAATQRIARISSWEMDLTQISISHPDMMGAILGQLRENACASSFEEFLNCVHPEDRELVRSTYEKVLEDMEPFHLEFRVILPSGGVRAFYSEAEVVCDSDNRPVKLICFGQDISERRRAEEALRESTKFQQQLIDTLPLPVFYKDAEGRYLGCNTAFEGLLNKSRKEIVGRSMLDLFDRELANLCHEMDLALANNPGVQTFETSIRDAEGAVRDVVVHRATFPRADGSVGGTIGAIIDISERRRAEEERVRLATAIEQAGEGIFLTDRSWVIQYVNPAFERLTGYGRDEIIGQHTRILRSHKHDKEFYGKMREILTSGRVWSGRLVNKKKDGTLYDAEVTASAVKDESGAIINFVSIHRDITHEARLERELRQAQKMEAIGTLAGGIAHDFNNILGIIIGYAELALFNSTEMPRLQQHLERVKEAGLRAKELVKQILTFSRQSEQERKAVEITPTIKEALKLLRSSLPVTIEIHQEIAVSPEDGIVLADPTQIHQVLMNLCTNAAHAMRGKGGVLSVQLTVVEADAALVSKHPELMTGPYLCLTVSDTGHGMDAAVLERIYDPYFTTKGPGEGTGLGLAVVRGIVKSYGGAITVRSEPGQGTTFNVFIPKIDATVSPRIEGMEPLPTGSERVLFVDDELDLADSGKSMLESLGYEVTVKARSLEALEAFGSDPAAFDLVITDMTMPGLTGSELAEKLMALRPDIPVILCTGYSELINEKLAKDAGIREFMMKPYGLARLATTVRKALEKKRDAPGS